MHRLLFWRGVVYWVMTHMFVQEIRDDLSGTRGDPLARSLMVKRWMNFLVGTEAEVDVAKSRVLVARHDARPRNGS